MIESTKPTSTSTTPVPRPGRAVSDDEDPNKPETPGALERIGAFFVGLGAGLVPPFRPVQPVWFGVPTLLDPEAVPAGQAKTDAGASWDAAAKYMADAWKNEETRFSNLNTRAMALVTATSLITTVLGFFAKNVFDRGETTRLSADQLQTAEDAFRVALIVLVVTAVLIVFCVLRPGGRYLFGNNLLVGTIPRGEKALRRGSDLTDKQMAEVAAREYAAIFVRLATRNKWKAYFLNLAYLTFLVGVIGTAWATWQIVSVIAPTP